MPGLACPNCDSKDYTQKNKNKGPEDIGEMRFRQHRCLNCRRVFITVQAVVDQRLAEQMLTLIEQPKPGSSRTPSVAALSMRELMKQSSDEDSTSTSEASA